MERGMKWNSKPGLDYPNVTGERVRTFFAWWPVGVGSDGTGYEWRWLERVTIEERYVSMIGWEVVRFLPQNRPAHPPTVGCGEGSNHEKP